MQKSCWQDVRHDGQAEYSRALIIGTVNIAIVHRQLKIGRNLAVPIFLINVIHNKHLTLFICHSLKHLFSSLTAFNGIHLIFGYTFSVNSARKTFNPLKTAIFVIMKICIPKKEYKKELYRNTIKVLQCSLIIVFYFTYDFFHAGEPEAPCSCTNLSHLSMVSAYIVEIYWVKVLIQFL